MNQIEEIIPHFYSFSKWRKYHILAGFSDRTCNFSRDAEIGPKNVFLSKLGLNLDSVIFPQQVHGNAISYVFEGSLTDTECDGFITNEYKTPLAILTADCVPVFFFSPTGNIAGIVHAGWRGISKGIIPSLYDKIKFKFNVKNHDMHFAIGPAIRSCCYEIGEDVAQYFKDYIIRKQGRIYLDLVEVIKSELIQRGVLCSNIIDSQICTYCKSDIFFSYRKEGDISGRILSIIFLKTEDIG